MMNVYNDELVIDKKGIYSIESFIIARRLMYWQVYLHKTVICIEQMVVKAIARARHLLEQGEKLEASPALSYFLQHQVAAADFAHNEQVFQTITSALDDVDIFSAFKTWRRVKDKVLSTLCEAIL